MKNENGISLKYAIFKALEKNRMLSINSMLKEVSKNFNFPGIHRLFLSGYLDALEDVGILVSKDIPPSRVYMLKKDAEKLFGMPIDQVSKETARRMLVRLSQKK